MRMVDPFDMIWPILFKGTECATVQRSIIVCLNIASLNLGRSNLPFVRTICNTDFLITTIHTNGSLPTSRASSVGCYTRSKCLRHGNEKKNKCQTDREELLHGITSLCFCIVSKLRKRRTKLPHWNRILLI